MPTTTFVYFKYIKVHCSIKLYAHSKENNALEELKLRNVLTWEYWELTSFLRFVPAKEETQSVNMIINVYGMACHTFTLFECAYFLDLW